MNRKILYLEICICCIFLLGCAKSADVRDDTIEELEMNNPFFIIPQDKKAVFQGRVFFDSFGDISVPKCKFNVEYLKMDDLKNGTLYQVKIINQTKYEIPEERLNMGYFYVQENKIVRLWDDDLWNISEKCINNLKKYDSVPKNSIVVCQSTNIEDHLNEEEEGWHYYLEVEEDVCTSHLWYQYPQHIGYWESFKWEKNVGLISYQSGFRDGVNYIKIRRP